MACTMITRNMKISNIPSLRKSFERRTLNLLVLPNIMRLFPSINIFLSLFLLTLEIPNCEGKVKNVVFYRFIAILALSMLSLLTLLDSILKSSKSNVLTLSEFILILNFCCDLSVIYLCIFSCLYPCLLLYILVNFFSFSFVSFSASTLFSSVLNMLLSFVFTLARPIINAF